MLLVTRFLGAGQRTLGPTDEGTPPVAKLSVVGQFDSSLMPPMGGENISKAFIPIRIGIIATTEIDVTMTSARPIPTGAPAS
jgi:hypothetical protein